jgi:hypothetical protein
MKSVTPEWFWFWFGLLMLDILARLVARVLAVSSFGVRTFRDHHNIMGALALPIAPEQSLSIGRSGPGICDPCEVPHITEIIEHSTL